MWNQLDRMVKDKADNTNNRFGVGAEINRRLTEGPFPFWGCPPRDTLTTLQPKRAKEHGPSDLPEFRHADLAAKGAASIWKLYYNGSVGGQAILGIPVVRRLKLARGERFKVWPFETGWKALGEADLAGVEVVVAEVYPSLVKATPLPGEVKDAAQVRATAEHFAKLDEAGKLGAIFGPGKGVAADVVVDAQHEEGWILGALSALQGSARQQPEPSEQQGGGQEGRPYNRPQDARDAHLQGHGEVGGQGQHDQSVARQVGQRRRPARRRGCAGPGRPPPAERRGPGRWPTGPGPTWPPRWPPGRG